MLVHENTSSFILPELLVDMNTDLSPSGSVEIEAMPMLENKFKTDCGKAVGQEIISSSHNSDKKG